MRTTLDLDDRLMKEAKKRAAEEGRPVTRVMEDALRRYLSGEPPAKPFKLKLLTRKARLVPGVDLADRDSLYERMDERS